MNLPKPQVATGILSLTGVAGLAEYQAALRSVTYLNTSPKPDTTDRVVLFVGNDGSDDSATATSTIEIEGPNVPPN